MSAFEIADKCPNVIRGADVVKNAWAGMVQSEDAKEHAKEHAKENAKEHAKRMRKRMQGRGAIKNQLLEE